MNKKILITTIISITLLACGCGNQKIKPTPSDIKPTSVKITESNPNEVKTVEETILGQWIIKKSLASSKVGTYSNDDIKKMLGRNLNFSKEKSSCFGDTLSYLDKVIDKPIYKKTVISKTDFEKDTNIMFKTLGLEGDSVTQFSVYDNENIICSFFVKDVDTLILYGGGEYLELARASSINPSSTGTAEVKITRFGYPITFPASWKDKYKIVETDVSVSVYFNPKEKADDGLGLFFTIIKKTNALDESRYDSVGDFTHFEFKDIAYFIGGPMDINFSETHTEFKTFLQMKKEVPGILMPLKQYQIP
jgi:hypothetical protein